MKVTSQYLKRAWVRDASVPPGTPAKGKINCPCGGAPWSDFNASQPNVVCSCGVEYTWQGWIVKGGDK